MYVIYCLVCCDQIVPAIENLSAFGVLGVRLYLIRRPGNDAPKQRTY